MDITVEELKHKIDAGENPLVIDVREQYEYDEFNIGARLIPLSTLPAHIEEFASDKDREIIIHCRSGQRSATAKAIMQGAGFTNVRNLLGGMMDWQLKFGK